MEGIAQVVRGLPSFADPNLIVGASNFSDAGVYRLRDDLWIVQSVDFFPPLVDDPFVFGQIAAANSLSDLYAMGAIPVTAMNVVCFPDDELSLDILTEILRGGSDRVQQAGAVVLGGHTVRDKEIKFGLAVTGHVTPDRMRTNQDARPGDVLILTKALGTGFVTTAAKAHHCPDDVLQAAIDRMVALNQNASDAAVLAGARAATDITGFGLAGHACELAQASKVTLAIQSASLPLLPGAAELARQGFMTRASASNRNFCQAMMRVDGNVDPLQLEFLFDAQTSGGLLIAVPADRADSLLQLLRGDETSDATIVGSVLEPQDVALWVR